MRALMFSDKWFEKFRENINSNKNYEEYAADWEGDIVISIKGDSMSQFFRKGELKNVKLELFHGKCKSISFPASISEGEVPYILEGTATVWENILSGKVNVITAMLKGDVNVKGDVRKLMKYVNAAQELVKSACSVD
ncbi:MAG: SCP2 sterol-binding domain-containing protein [Candidatus Bathyarchaeia archaeon]